MDEGEDDIPASISKGRVVVNDPFLCRMHVCIDDGEKEVNRWVSYSFLRNKPEETADEFAAETVEIAAEISMAAGEIVPPCKKKAKIHPKQNEVNMLDLLPAMDGEQVVPLTCAPCINGMIYF